MRQPVSLEHANRLINHGPTVLVSSAHGNRRNLMAAAWSMPVEFTPPRVAVVIDESTYTRDLVLAGGTFALNLPCRAIADLAYTVGSVSGRDDADDGLDKFERYAIEHFEGRVLGLPLVTSCVAWLECRVLSEPQAQQAYDTFFAEVLSAEADDRVFANGRWSFRDDNAALHTLHHLGGGSFALPVEHGAGHGAAASLRRIRFPDVIRFPAIHSRSSSFTAGQGKRKVRPVIAAPRRDSP